MPRATFDISQAETLTSVVGRLSLLARERLDS